VPLSDHVKPVDVTETILVVGSCSTDSTKNSWHLSQIRPEIAT
jgi:hypothetical protein